MKRIFYTLWADAIYWELIRPRKRQGEILAPFVIICSSQFMNLLSIPLLARLLNIEPGIVIGSINSWLTIRSPYDVLYWLVPVSMLNYFLIFFKRDYIAMAKDQRTYGGRLYIAYAATSWLVFTGLLFINSYKNSL